MANWLATNERCAILAIALLAGVQKLNAQYLVQEWANFEDGRLPASAVTIGKQTGSCLQVVDVASVADAPLEFRAPQLHQEIGHYVLKVRHVADSTSESVMAGLLLGRTLDRQKLGPGGRVLVQADIFLPTPQSFPSMALLTMEKPEGAGLPQSLPIASGAFYRFGMSRSSDCLYFSHTQRKGVVEAKLDRELSPLVPRPGWHRFAIVFQGSSTISCFVDGRELPNSPQEQADIREFLPGVLLADSTPDSYEVYVDNIAVQSSPGVAVLPDSPYGDRWTIPAGSQKHYTASYSSTPTPPPSPNLQWLQPEQAWALARQQRRPMLLYFCAPGSGGTQRVDNLLATTPRATTFLNTHTCGRVDTTQPQGEALARQYEVFKLPTLLVIDCDARCHRRVTPTDGETWEHIETGLQLP